MPRRPLKPCNHAGCRALTAQAYCQAHEEQHKPKAWQSTKGSAHSRGYGAHWRRLRALILTRDPICKACSRRPSNQVDHVVPKSQGGSDDPTNLRGICDGCHKAKTGLDARAGRRKP